MVSHSLVLAVDLVTTPTHPLERKLLAFQITNLPRFINSLTFSSLSLVFAMFSLTLPRADATQLLVIAHSRLTVLL